MFFCQFFFYSFFECFKIFCKNRKTCGLSVSPKRHKIFTTLFKEFNDAYVFRTPTTCNQFSTFIFECYCRLSKCFCQSSCDESYNAMLDIGRVIEKYSPVSIYYLKRMLYEVFGSSFTSAIEILEL